MSYTLAIKNKKGKYQRFTVPLEVSRYVKQLEAYIMLPGISKLKEAYPKRFAEAPDLLAACEMIENRLLNHGEWDAGCFYYAGKSASELEEPLNLIKAALAKAKKEFK